MNIVGIVSKWTRFEKVELNDLRYLATQNIKEQKMTSRALEKLNEQGVIIQISPVEVTEPHRNHVKYKFKSARCKVDYPVTLLGSKRLDLPL